MSSVKRQHLNAHFTTFLVTTANTEVAIAHELGRVPEEAFVLRKAANANVYRGSTAWTSTTIYVTASAVASGILLLI